MMTKKTEQLVDNKLIQRITIRLIPLLLTCYIFAHLDRVNISFAKENMSANLNLSYTMYGTGAGLFFIAYMLFGIPSNILLEKFGPRRWIAIIMFVWGIVSTSTILVTNHYQFYLLRLLLGAAEAGFFPGILIYINHWFPRYHRGKITSMFTLAIPLASVIGAPASGWAIDTLQGSWGLNGWQWMFLIEGIPVILLSIVILCYLPNDYQQANWLTTEEKQQLAQEQQKEEATKDSMPFFSFIKDTKLLLLFGIYFAVMLGMNAINFWMPNLIQTTGVKTQTTIGFLSALCWGIACIFMILMGISSDKNNERRWHLIIPLLMISVGFIGAGLFSNNTLLVVIFLGIATMGATAALPMFWQIPPIFLTNKDAVTGIALVSSLGNLGGFLAPYLIGWIKDNMNSTSIGLYILALFILLGAALVMLIPSRFSHFSD